VSSKRLRSRYVFLIDLVRSMTLLSGIALIVIGTVMLIVARRMKPNQETDAAIAQMESSE